MRERRKVSRAESKKVVEGGGTAEGDDETEEDEDSIDIPSPQVLWSVQSNKLQTTHPLF